jgi:hypothetical protein
MFRKILLIICVFALLAGCTAKKSTPTPTPLPPTATLIPPTNTPPPPMPQPTEAELSIASAGGPYPMARMLSNIVYNPKTDQALMLGGMQSHVLGTPSMEDWYFGAQTKQWTYDGNPMPLGCNFGSPVVYDAHAEKILLYCPGSGYGARVAIWEYTPEGIWPWTDRQSTNTPAGSVSVRMVYDSESQKSIIIGGLDYGTWQTFNETWAYDYDTNTWTRMSPKTQPPGLYAHAMAYDAESDRVIMWGGNVWIGMDSEGNWLSENPENLVWAYDYNTDTWESFPVTNGPDVVRVTQMAQTIQATYASNVDRTYFYWENQFWAYDYNTNSWEKAKGDVMSGAGNRVSHVMVYLPTIERILVFGGANMGKEWWDLTYHDDTWLYDPKTGDWAKVGP